MIVDNKEFNPELHEQFKAITMRQPFADFLARGEKDIAIFGRNMRYRGDILICSSATPEIPCRESGKVLAIAELYDVKPVKDFSGLDWSRTAIEADEIGKHQRRFGWMFRNVRRVVEMPVKGKQGIYTITMPKGDLTEYPTAMQIDDKDWETIKKQIR